MHNDIRNIYLNVAYLRWYLYEIALDFVVFSLELEKIKLLILKGEPVTGSPSVLRNLLSLQ